MTAAACDGNCACDPDCTASERELFSGALPEGPASPQLEYCVPSSSVVEVNLPKSGVIASVRRAAPPGEFFRELLCVAGDNNPALGNFFSDVGAGSASVLAGALDTDGRTSFARPHTVAAAAVVDDVYRVGDALPAALSNLQRSGAALTGPSLPPSTQATVPAGAGGVLSLPAPTLSGDCDNLAVVGFMTNVPFDASGGARSSCFRRVADFSTECSELGSLSAYDLVGRLRVAAAPTSSPTLLVPVVTRVRTMDAYGNLDAGTSDFSRAGAGVALPAASLAAGVCQNALRRVDYTAVHNGNGALTAITADVVVSDVPAASAGATQEFSVIFENTNSLKSGSWLRQSALKSGSPGYRPVFPVLGGFKATKPPASAESKVAIEQFAGGLPMPGPGADGFCDPSGAAPVEFGASSASSCHIPLTLEQLRAFCLGSSPGVGYTTFLANTRAALAAGGRCTDPAGAAGRPTDVPLQTSQLPSQILDGLFSGVAGGTHSQREVRVGIWGDSSSENAAEWLELAVESTELPAMKWDEATATCANVAAGVRYEFLTGKVGAQQSPQEKIAFGKVSFSTASWSFKDPLKGFCSQNFPATVHVDFASMDQVVTENVKPQVPPLLPRVPEGFMYPFY